MWITSIIDRLLYCPPGSVPGEVQYPTPLHRWWRGVQFRRFERNVAKRGWEVHGGADNGIWYASGTFKGGRPTLDAAARPDSCLVSYDGDRVGGSIVDAPVATRPCGALSDLTAKQADPLTVGGAGAGS